MRTRNSARGGPAAIALSAALASAALCGCATDEGYLSLAATHAVPLDSNTVKSLDFDKLPVKRDIEGSDTAITSVLFVPTFAGPRLEAAIDDAIESGQGDLLTRAHVRTTKYWFLVGIETLTVHGNVVDLPGER